MYVPSLVYVDKLCGFKKKIMQNKPNLQLDLTRKLSARERNENFAITGLKNGTDLAILRRKAENRDNWRDSVKLLVHKEQQLWNARDQKKKTKRDELRAARHQERTQRQRTIQDYFGRRT